MRIFQFGAVRWMVVALAVSGATLPVALAQSAVCPAIGGFSATRELRYAVNARVRPLLFWIERTNVGEARITWSRAVSSERLELLVGSDPERTPFRVNRWGYIAETVCEAGADLIGVMTESEETSVEQAASNTTDPMRAGQTFRVIRARVQGGRSEAEVARLWVPQSLTYRHVGELLPAVLGTTGEKRAVDVERETQPGFLLAVASLAGRLLTESDLHARRIPAIRYVYNGQLFDLETTSSTVRSGEQEIEYRTRNVTTGRTTRFTVRFDRAERALVPTRIRFRPRWWFEADLVLNRPATVTAVGALAGRETP